MDLNIKKGKIGKDLMCNKHTQANVDFKIEHPIKEDHMYRVTTYEGFGPKKEVGKMSGKDFRSWKKHAEAEGVEYEAELI